MRPTPPARTTLLETINVHLGLLAWLITRQLSQKLRDFDLTLPQFVVLIALSGHSEPCLMSHLAHLIRQTPATLTGIIDRLLKAGLVQRTGSETDRRIVLVRATPAGVSLVKQIQTELLQTISGSFAPLTDEALFTVEQLLTSVLSACAEGPSPLPAAGLDDKPQKVLLPRSSFHFDAIQ